MASEDGLEEGSEDNLSTTECWESEPEGESKLEGVVEREPVDSADGALKESQEGKHNPVSQPLRVVGLARTEQSIKGVVAWNCESSKVGQELASDVEKD